MTAPKVWRYFVSYYYVIAHLRTSGHGNRQVNLREPTYDMRQIAVVQQLIARDLPEGALVVVTNWREFDPAPAGMQSGGRHAKHGNGAEPAGSTSNE